MVLFSKSFFLSPSDSAFNGYYDKQSKVKSSKSPINNAGNVGNASNTSCPGDKRSPGE